MAIGPNVDAQFGELARQILNHSSLVPDIVGLQHCLLGVNDTRSAASLAANELQGELPGLAILHPYAVEQLVPKLL